LAGNTAELYDPVTGTFSATSAPTRYRYSAAGVPLNDGRALVFGYDAAVMRSMSRVDLQHHRLLPGRRRLWFGPAMASLADAGSLWWAARSRGPRRQYRAGGQRPLV